MVAVHEVEVGALGNGFEQRIFALRQDLVPTDVRNALARPDGMQPNDPAGDQPEAIMSAAFLAAVGQQLHAKTDTQ